MQSWNFPTLLPRSLFGWQNRGWNVLNHCQATFLTFQVDWGFAAGDFYRLPSDPGLICKSDWLLQDVKVLAWVTIFRHLVCQVAYYRHRCLFCSQKFFLLPFYLRLRFPILALQICTSCTEVVKLGDLSRQFALCETSHLAHNDLTLSLQVKDRLSPWLDRRFTPKAHPELIYDKKECLLIRVKQEPQ